MPRNQQFVRMLNPKHLDADKCRSDHDRVLRIRRNRIRSQKPRQPLALFATEGDITADLFGWRHRIHDRGERTAYRSRWNSKLISGVQ